MTVNPGAVSNISTDTTTVDLERLHVAARSVLTWLDEVRTDMADVHAEHLGHHAQALLDEPEAPPPFAATRAHALRVRNELVLVGTERALTIAVWIDDALGLEEHGSRVVTADPAETTG
jgi:hypothetical protein